MADKEKTTAEQLQELKERIAAQLQADTERRTAAGLSVDLGLTEAEKKERAAKYRPELDPFSPAFDVEKYAAANGGIKELQQAINKTKQEMSSGLNGMFRETDASNISDLMAIRFIDSARSFYNFIVDHPEIIDNIERFSRLSEFIEKEILKPEYGGKSIEDLYRAGHNEADEVIRGSLWEKAENAARLALEQAEQENKIERQQSRRPKRLAIPTDKFNTQVMIADWLGQEKELDGQIGMFPVKMEADNYPKELTLYYIIDYPAELAEAERKLTPTDRRVYNATYWLQQTNGNDMTFNQLAKQIFGEKPTKTQLERLKKSVDKMRLIGITWDNREEAAAYHTDGQYITYKGYLYPVEIIEQRKIFNGQMVDAYIRALKPLPLLEFAKERRQVATIPANILQTRLSMTDLNIALQDYLIKRIEQDKSKRNRTDNPSPKPLKILYDTLYKSIGANTRQKQRTSLKNLYIYLEELKQKGYIKAFKEETTKSTGATGVAIEY